MSTILFDKIVFGPIHSRRLGISLGMNLLPTDGKLCSFNCIYCECGLNENHRTRSHTVRVLCLPREEDAEAGGARHHLPPRGEGRGTLAAADHLSCHPVALTKEFYPQRAERVFGDARGEGGAADRDDVPDAVRMRDGRPTQRRGDAPVRGGDRARRGRRGAGAEEESAGGPAALYHVCLRSLTHTQRRGSARTDRRTGGRGLGHRSPSTLA